MKKFILPLIIFIALLVIVVFVITSNEAEAPVEDTVEESSSGSDSTLSDENIREAVRAIEGGVEVSFAHVAPGEYSEIYVSSSGHLPNEDVTILLNQDLTTDIREIKVTADSDGVATATYRITQFGKYDVAITDIDGEVIGGGSVEVN